MLDELDVAKRFAGIAVLRGRRYQSEEAAGLLNFAQLHTERVNSMQRWPKRWPMRPDDIDWEREAFSKVGTALGRINKPTHTAIRPPPRR